MIELGGIILVALFSTASLVISFTASALSSFPPFSAVVPIHGIDPAKNSGCLLEGVPPHIVFPKSPSLTFSPAKGGLFVIRDHHPASS